MSQRPSDREEIQALYSSLHRAMVAGDTGCLAAMLTDDFHLIHMTGYDQPRVEWLAHIDSGQMQYHASEEKRVAVKVAGNKATLIGRNLVKATIWGMRGTWPLQLDIDLILQNGRWLMCEARASMY